MTRHEDGSWSIDGRTDVDELAGRLGLGLSDEIDYHTAAGLMLDRLGRIPAVGDSIESDGWIISVSAMDGNRIDRLLAKPVIGEDESELG